MAEPPSLRGRRLFGQTIAGGSGSSGLSLLDVCTGHTFFNKSSLPIKINTRAVRILRVLFSTHCVASFAGYAHVSILERWRVYLAAIATAAQARYASTPLAPFDALNTSQARSTLDKHGDLQRFRAPSLRARTLLSSSLVPTTQSVFMTLSPPSPLALYMGTSGLGRRHSLSVRGAGRIQILGMVRGLLVSSLHEGRVGVEGTRDERGCKKRQGCLVNNANANVEAPSLFVPWADTVMIVGCSGPATRCRSQVDDALAMVLSSNVGVRWTTAARRRGLRVTCGAAWDGVGSRPVPDPHAVGGVGLFDASRDRPQRRGPLMEGVDEMRWGKKAEGEQELERRARWLAGGGNPGAGPQRAFSGLGGNGSCAYTDAPPWHLLTRLLSARSGRADVAYRFRWANEWPLDLRDCARYGIACGLERGRPQRVRRLPYAAVQALRIHPKLKTTDAGTPSRVPPSTRHLPQTASKTNTGHRILKAICLGASPPAPPSMLRFPCGKRLERRTAGSSYICGAKVCDSIAVPAGAALRSDLHLTALSDEADSEVTISGWLRAFAERVGNRLRGFENRQVEWNRRILPISSRKRRVGWTWKHQVVVEALGGIHPMTVKGKVSTGRLLLFPKSRLVPVDRRLSFRLPFSFVGMGRYARGVDANESCSPHVVVVNVDSRANVNDRTSLESRRGGFLPLAMSLGIRLPGVAMGGRQMSMSMICPKALVFADSLERLRSHKWGRALLNAPVTHRSTPPCAPTLEFSPSTPERAREDFGASVADNSDWEIGEQGSSSRVGSVVALAFAWIGGHEKRIPMLGGICAEKEKCADLTRVIVRMG
ncbi:hypothetical protein R3P38DRAFT_2788831 [Favolaschia claudopus]|uniref:Uncharacterized protein n=1 Tax=Favolaschia claudopus TaxID=2862362 RepID=A0AAW0AJD8_9AGAR